MIRIGTSGFSFPDWHGTFYPRQIKPNQFFDYYVQFFDTVEINLTFYTTPSKKFFESLVERAKQGFIFTVKLPAKLTHEQEISEKTISLFTNSIEPIVRENKLGGVLAQFPYGFRANKENIDYVLKLSNTLKPLNVFVEFRQADWANPKIYELLTSENIGLVYPDLPELKGLFTGSPELEELATYFRFHGRNKTNWWKANEKERYDYDYTISELTELVTKMKRAEKRSQIVFGFFNNCFLGRAARNALSALQMLGVNKKERGLFDQEI